MKTSILADGTLKVESETDIEHYALNKWWEGWNKKEKESIFHVVITGKDNFKHHKTVENDESLDKEQ